MYYCKQLLLHAFCIPISVNAIQGFALAQTYCVHAWAPVAVCNGAELDHCLHEGKGTCQSCANVSLKRIDVYGPQIAPVDALYMPGREISLNQASRYWTQAGGLRVSTRRLVVGITNKVETGRYNRPDNGSKQRSWLWTVSICTATQNSDEATHLCWLSYPQSLQSIAVESLDWPIDVEKLVVQFGLKQQSWSAQFNTRSLTWKCIHDAVDGTLISNLMAEGPCWRVLDWGSVEKMSMDEAHVFGTWLPKNGRGTPWRRSPSNGRQIVRATFCRPETVVVTRCYIRRV